MPRIRDDRILQGKQNRDRAIRRFFDRRFNQGLRYEIIEDEIILKWGISANYLYKLLKSDEKDEKNKSNAGR